MRVWVDASRENELSLRVDNFGIICGDVFPNCCDPLIANEQIRPNYFTGGDQRSRPNDYRRHSSSSLFLVG